MTRAKLIASRRLWRSREAFRYTKWRHYVKTRPTGDPLRAKWHSLWDAAHKARVARDRQLAKQPIAHIDEAGYQFILREEGKRNSPYNDSQRYATVGVGHLLHKSPFTPQDVLHWTLTDAEVETLFRKDISRFEKVVADSFKGSPFFADQAKFNACTSLAFNVGTGGYASSTVARCVKAGQKDQAANAFLMWAHPIVLLPRRQRERSLFLS